MTKINPSAPHVLRLWAVMECLNPDYVTRGGQKKFAAEIGVEQNQYNNIINGTGLSNKVASAIVRRFPVVSRDFLFDGLPGRGNAEFEQKLWAWQDRNGKQIFSSDVFRQTPLPHGTPTTKAKSAVEADPISQRQETVDTLRRMIEATKPTLRATVTITALQVIVSRAQELIAELQKQNDAS